MVMVTGSTAWQTPWFAEQDALLRDGNPIFTALCFQQRRGLRVIQHPPTSPGTEFTWYLDWFAKDQPGILAIRELVVSMALSMDALRDLSMIMLDWMDDPEKVEVEFAMRGE